MPDLSSGTVTFLFTDIEGSTQLWEKDQVAMAVAVARHIALLDAAIQAHVSEHCRRFGNRTTSPFAVGAQSAGNGVPSCERAHVEERRNTTSVRYGRLIEGGLLELPQMGALPALEESLGRAKNMDPTQGRIHAGRVQEPRVGPEKTLADEGQVVVAAGGVGDGRAAIGGDTQGGQVPDIATVDEDRAAPGVADANSVTGIAAAVNVADLNRTATGRRRRNAAVPRRGGICELHDGLPSLMPTPLG